MCKDTYIVLIHVISHLEIFLFFYFWIWYVNKDKLQSKEEDS